MIMQRTLIADTIKNVGKEVKLCGWVNNIRAHGKVLFCDLRDRSGLAQIVFVPNQNSKLKTQKSKIYELARSLRPEWVIEVIGKVGERPKGMENAEMATGKVEISASQINILAKSEALPFDIKKDMEISLPVLLDYRALTLRNEKIKAIFKIQEQAINSFRKALSGLGFFEFQAPTIVPVATEGGSEVFRVDYYGRDAFLAQSPQLYKQVMVGVFERVFTLAHAYRAEPSVTTRHIAEYISLDAEMGFIDSWEDLMNVCETVVKNMFKRIEKNCSKELNIFEASLPLVKGKIPRLKMRQAQQIIFERTKRDNRKEPDLTPDDEQEICKWAKQEKGSDLLFITHYPTKKRPFYTFPDPENPEYTLSFDMLCRGLEIVTGGQRINDYKQLLSNVKKWGNKPEDFELYLQAFKYGMPPEGGFAMGAERIVKQILGLQNLREANLFPRDMGRIDRRLSYDNANEAALDDAPR